jgi:hypothetical protein
VDEYRTAATPVMTSMSNIVEKLNFQSSTSRAEARTALNALQGRIDGLPCRSSYPLKHETLQFTLTHLLNALAYADSGDFTRMNQSLDKSLLNAQRFSDWTVDLD